MPNYHNVKSCEMLYRKIAIEIENHLLSDSDKILVVEGARQIGKSYIIRYVGSKLFNNFLEINFVEDDEGPQLFKNIRSTDDLYFALGTIAGNKLNKYEDTLVFLDEIQTYPQYLTLLKFLKEEKKYKFIASGSLLGVTLRETTSIPIGSILRKQMFPLDFEEFLIANQISRTFINQIREFFNLRRGLPSEFHELIMKHFRRFLLVGGMPDAVNAYLESQNIMKVREIQNEIHNLYGVDASRYEDSFSKKLLIRDIYNMIPSRLENIKKRFIFKDIQGIKNDRYSRYMEEFEYLVSAGITINVKAVSNPVFPLEESASKNLFKLYMNDTGILTSRLYATNVQPVMSDIASVNLGSVYENVVATELKAHGYKLFYYDNRKRGEVDFLINDYERVNLLPIEVKSGKDYKRHVALSNFLKVKDYNIHMGVVFSNTREVETRNDILYLPIYYVMFLNKNISNNPQDLIF